jgi:hypothetical protein
VEPGAPQSSILTVPDRLCDCPCKTRCYNPRAITIPLRIAAQPIQLIEHSQLNIRVEAVINFSVLQRFTLERVGFMKSSLHISMK